MTTSPKVISSARTRLTANNANLTINKPRFTTEGHLMVAVIACRRTITAIARPSGWSVAFENFTANSSALGIYYKFATASEPDNYTFTTTGTAGVSAGAILAIENADPVTPFGPIGSTASGSVSTVTHPSITTTEDNSLLLFVGYQGNASAQVTDAAGGGHNLVTKATSANSSDGCSFTVGYDYQELAGATGTRTSPFSSTSNSLAVSLAINAASPTGNRLDALWGIGSALSTSTGWQNYTIRQRITASLLNVAADGVRLGFSGPPASASFPIDRVVIAKKGAGNFDFAATPVEVTFNGAAGVVLGAGEVVISDEVLIDIDGTSDYVVGIYVSNVGAASAGFSTSSYSSAFSRGYILGNDLGSLTATGYDTSGTSVTFVVDIDLVFAGVTSIEEDISFSWDIPEATSIEAQASFSWDLLSPPEVSGDAFFEWAIPLVSSVQFSWDLSNLTDTFDHQFHVKGATKGGRVGQVQSGKTTASLIKEGFLGSVGPLTDIGPPIGSDILTGVGSYHFYGDYYERIWIDPLLRRIPNPRINSPYSFDVWNAYSKTNELGDVTNINLPGVELEFPSGLQWSRYQTRSLEYTITPSAPSTVDGSFFLEFLYGEGSTRLVAVIIDVLRTQPNEPMQEVWQWATSVTSTYGQVEQRSALRDQPRVMVRYTANLADAEERLRAYRQFYSFINRSVLVPMFQYTTPLEEEALAGSFDLKFDLSVADVRLGEYVVLFNKDSMTYELYQAFGMGANGIVLENPLAFDRSEGWEIIPTRAMRLPDATALSMGAVNGDLIVAGESVSFRALERPASVSSYPVYSGELIIPDRPVAIDNLPEAFKGGVEVIDNDTSNPQLATAWPAPMVQTRRYYQIDRDTDMDYWKAIFAEIKGRHKSFFIPTWRDDVPLVGTVNLGDAFLVTSNIDILDYYESQAYRHLQIESEAGVIYRLINSVELIDDTALITLGGDIGSSPGANVIKRVSYVYRARLDSDEVVLQHYRNWSIIELQLRTVNE